MAEIGIVIVTHNSGKEIGACLDAALSSGADVVVVDNASSDNTIVEIARRGARLISNPDNRGFAAAVNQGFAVLSSPYIVLLNPDAVIQSELAPLRLACDLPRAAAAGGKMMDSEGRPQIGFMARRLPTPAALIGELLLINRLWPGNPVNRQYRLLHLDPGSPREVEQPAGAFLMIRRSVWQELGGFDEKFAPLWFEDVDFCRRVIDRGYSIQYAPGAVVKHTGGHSISSLPVEKRQYYWYCSLLRYSAKHFRPWAFGVVCLAVVTGSLLRGFGESALRGSLRPMQGLGQVVRLAGRSLLFGWRDEAVV
jgi:GT2 family glycosyltransferase